MDSGVDSEPKVLAASERTRPLFLKSLRLGWILLRLGLLVVVAGVVFHEWMPQSYRYPEPRPFRGSNWYNPYQGLEHADLTPGLAREGSRPAPSGSAANGVPASSLVAAVEPAPVHWLRSCFHAHSKSWLGVTDGADAVTQIVDAYQQRDFDLIGISNYHSIRPQLDSESLYLECYEHGYGTGQHHFTVIGSKSVSWYDFPFYKRLHHKQHLIEHLADRAEILVINHPNKSDAYSPDDMRQLVGYDGIEVATRYSNGREHWDAALTAGRRVWGFCGDDTHEYTRYDAFARGWMMVGAQHRSREGVLEALRAGRFYGVWTRRYEVRRNRLLKCDVEDGVIHVVFERPLDMIRIYSQTGIIRVEYRKTAEAHYPIRGDDPYVRIEGILFDKWGFEGANYFLNPIYRYEEDPNERFEVVVDEEATRRRRGWVLGAVLMTGLGWGMRRWWGRDRRRSGR